ncbi:hypothetical protein FRAHR75_950005 [Frankia sp. Hr75.2]|nr:hypothetical protein FRAHR75_950005 [Frankia sp. Hr75.2]
MVRLFRQAADEARVLSDYPLVERLLTAAVSLIDPTDTDELIAVRTDRHAALYNLGRLDEADDEYQTITRLCTHPTQRSAATVVQVGSLTIRTRASEAMRLGLDQLRQLGLAAPDRDHLEAEIDRGLDAVYRWIDQTSESDDLRRPRITDRSRLGAIKLVNQLAQSAFFSDQPMLAWLTLQALELWARYGPDPALLGPAGNAAHVTITRRNDYRTGHRIMRRILAVGRARRYEPAVWQAQYSYVAAAGHWFDALEDNLPTTRRAQEGLLQGGDLKNACWTHYVLVTNLLDCAPSLEVFVVEVDEALAFAARTGNSLAEEVFRVYRQLARVLRGEAVTSAADEAAALTMAAASPPTAVLLHSTRALAAAILDQPAELARQTAAMMQFGPIMASTYAMAVARVLRSIAVAAQAREAPAGQRGALLAELDESVAWLAARAADAPVNFRHLLRLAEAERAWTAGDFREAVYTFDVAQREASARARPWHRALILERAARFYLAHGVEESGCMLLAAARRQYQDWGATAKVRQLDWAHPTLQAAPVGAQVAAQPLSTPAARGPTVTTGSIDLLGVVAASQALSSETGIDGLQARVVGILSAMTGATRVHLLLRAQQEHGWRVPTGDGGATVPLDEAGRRRLLPPSIIWYAERTHEPLVVDDATGDDRFRRDSYFTDLDRCALLAIPITIRGELRAMLLLENRMIRGAFTTERLEGIMLIAGQLAVSLDNAQVYASLERKVAERTRQLAAANQRLELLSVTDELTGLANRRHLDEALDTKWRRAARQKAPIAFAMIDIDHFKLYNDRFGHAAGDRCLQRVAACLAAGTRDTDLAARYGGEEFAVVMPSTVLDAATRLAGRLRFAIAELAEPHPLGLDHIVTVSIGITAIIPTPADDLAALVELADAALYQARGGGRNRVETALPRGRVRRPSRR